MQAFFDDGHELVVYDETPNSEKHYSARFYFDPNSMQLTSQTGFYMLGINSGSTWGAACLYFEQQGDYYSLGLCGKNDAGTWFQSVPVLLADEWQSVEVEWKAATAPGANNGYIKLWIGDQLSSAIENLDSDSQAITQASWGPSDSSFTASGSMYFDAFESRRGEHIGLDANGPAVSPPSARPDVIFSDGFESGNFSDWNPTLNVLDGGDLSVSASAAHQGGYGMQALIDDTTALKVVDSSPAAENHYRARFYFHPNSISMNSGSAHFIFDGIDNYYDWVLFRLELLYESGVYKIRPRVMTDIYTNINGSKYAISNGWHVIEIDWKKSTAPGANNGYLSLWIDGALAGTISNVDNDSLNNLLDEVRLGATAGIDSTTSGSMLFDQFVSHRQTYIGP